MQEVLVISLAPGQHRNVLYSLYYHVLTQEEGSDWMVDGGIDVICHPPCVGSDWMVDGGWVYPKVSSIPPSP